MNKQVYPVVISKEGSGYYVDIPDFNSATEGKDLADAIYMARDCMGMLGITYQDEGKEIPTPNTSLVVKENEDDIVTYVDVDFDDYRRKHDMKKIRRNVMIPSYLNEKANNLKINVSQVLTEALEEILIKN